MSSSSTPAPHRDDEVHATVSTDELARERRTILAALFTREAETDPRVSHFRRMILNNALLRVDQVDTWIALQSDRDGAPTPWVTYVPLESTDLEYLLRDDPAEFVDTSWWRSFRERLTASRTYHTLSYHRSNGTTATIRVRRDGVLDQLRQLSEDLAERYPWAREQATLFVLTGEPPEIHDHRFGFLPRHPSAGSRIVAELDPTLSGAQVRDGFLSFRDALLEGRPRLLSLKHLYLARFALSWPDDEDRRAMMQAWNETYTDPKWRYDNHNNFGRDIQRAQANLLHLNLRDSVGSYDERDEAEPRSTLSNEIDRWMTRRD